jgi:GT2 family glycosyltransferase
MPRFLIAIPFLCGPDHSKLAIESVLNQQYHDLLMIDNGSDAQTKAVLNHYHSLENVHIISNPENIYVNPAWNQAMEFFNERPQYDYLILMNSDLILQKEWFIELETFFNSNENKIPVPIITDDLNKYSTIDKSFNVIYGGISGVFVVVPRSGLKRVYPIPDGIKVWFGDNWIYDILRGVGYETGVLNSLITHHWWGGSRSIAKTPNVLHRIELDKINWHETVCHLVQEKISPTDKT